MQRLGTGNPGDGIHQLLLDLAALDVHGDVRVIHNRLTEKIFFSFGARYMGTKLSFFPVRL